MHDPHDGEEYAAWRRHLADRLCAEFPERCREIQDDLGEGSYIQLSRPADDHEETAA
jgi:hypothetical protein